ncbi:protein of unknown function [Moritella yayanosii]|uniref:Uncharacterized protein n=1 Tax=Moritella yayanosii TaxID=69539 RepID=A0A330LM49_9GAMM|nr:protein of unknown function [Moritella yayanosii]
MLSNTRFIEFNTIFIPLKVHLTPCHYLQIINNTVTYTHIDIDIDIDIDKNKA